MRDQLKLDASDNDDDNDFNDNDRVTNHENYEERHIYMMSTRIMMLKMRR